MFKFAAAGIIAKILNSLVANKQVKDLGITDDVAKGITSYLQNNTKLEQEIVEEIDKARQHDIKTGQNTSNFVKNLRGSIRPICTIATFIWYLYAKLNHIELTSEDYSIIGGVLAFWFGFRSYEKKNKIF